MKKEELIEELKKEIEVTKKVSNCEEHVKLYEKGKRVGLEFGWMIAEKLDEPELPVIPQFIAEFIQEIKNRKPLPIILYGALLEAKDIQELFDWVWKNGENHNAFAIAFITGKYEIKKEPEKLYQVILPTPNNMAEMMFLVEGRRVITNWFCSSRIENYKHQFTEQEIKAIDERYWAFAEPVEDSK